MLLLGLLLLVAAGVLTAGLLRDNTADSRAEIFGYSLPHLTIGELFLVGVVTGILATLGLAMLLGGLRRSGRRKRQQRQDLKAKRQREDQLKDENARLARELEEQRQSAPPMTSTTVHTTPVEQQTVSRTPLNPNVGTTGGATAADAPGRPLSQGNDVDPRNPRR